jgi:hypothetical protein
MKSILKSVLIIPAMVLALVSDAQVPVLSSYPSASSTILLDFDGHTVNGSSWNISGPIVCDATTLNTAQITEIFNRVAEDYRPFNVNITTDETKYTAAPLNKRIRVILTISNAWYGTSAGGVAFVGSFIWGDDTPCFVFTALLNNNAKNIAEAAAHESGHTLGLFHQAKYDVNCNYVSDYHSGTGSGEIGWAPIMGVGYYRNFTIWHNGPNPYGCNNVQNDLDVITAPANGIIFRTDDHNSAFNQATNAVFSSNQFTVNGVIETNTDQDLIRFILPLSGRFVLNAVPYNVGTGNSGSDLDMQVTLFNSSQTQINIYNPGALLSSVIDSVMSAGNYYLRIEGKGNENAPAYASLGSYALQGSFTAGNPLPLRKLELRGTLNGNRHQLNWIIDADEQVTDLSLEIMTDGRNFSPLYKSGVEARSFAYTAYLTNMAQYRLNVIFDNGRQYYSNIVSLKGNANTPKPQLAGNIIYANSITVSSPGNYKYSVSDVNGKIISRGTINNGISTITAPGLVNGLYLIRFSTDEQEWIEKIIRQ